jgi:hypothetical protein
VFRVDLSHYGMAAVRLVFGHEAGGGTTAMRTDLGSHPLSLQKLPVASRRSAWLTGTLAALAVAAAVRAARQARSRHAKEDTEVRP